MKKEHPVPENEVNRLKALVDYNVLDTLPEEEFDSITRLASYIAKTPIALVSLVDKDRQWFKSKVGLDAPETPRDISFCQYAIMDEGIFEVQDAREEVTFKDNPLVTGGPNIRFYAGVPLTSPDGYNIGTLCVISPEVSNLDENQKEALKTLSKQVVSNLELKKQNKELLNTKLEGDKFFNFKY